MSPSADYRVHPLVLSSFASLTPLSLRSRREGWEAWRRAQLFTHACGAFTHTHARVARRYGSSAVLRREMEQCEDYMDLYQGGLGLLSRDAEVSHFADWDKVSHETHHETRHETRTHEPFVRTLGGLARALCLRRVLTRLLNATRAAQKAPRASPLCMCVAAFWRSSLTNSAF